MKNNSAPTKLSVASLKDINALDGFCCGVPLMDKFLHGKFQESIDHNYCKAFVVKDDCDIVAVYALNFDSLSLDIDAKDDLRFNVEYLSDDSRLSIEYGDTFYGKAHYPALEISYLAVSEKWHGKNIGSFIIESIADEALDQGIAGCQFLTVEALAIEPYSAVAFYYKCGFEASELRNPLKETLRMYRMLPFGH